MRDTTSPRFQSNFAIRHGQRIAEHTQIQDLELPFCVPLMQSLLEEIGIRLGTRYVGSEGPRITQAEYTDCLVMLGLRELPIAEAVGVGGDDRIGGQRCR
jgi:hypothetical protein